MIAMTILQVSVMFAEITSKVIAESQQNRAKLQYVPMSFNLYQCAQIALFAQKQTLLTMHCTINCCSISRPLNVALKFQPHSPARWQQKAPRQRGWVSVGLPLRARFSTHFCLTSGHLFNSIIGFTVFFFDAHSSEFLLKTKFIFGAKLLRGVKLTVITEPSVRAKHRHVQGAFVND